MRDAAGESIDQLITLEIRNSGIPSNFLRALYRSARRLTADQPVSAAAASALMKHARKGDTVLILTGAGAAPTLPRGESDGPPGAASLAKILYKGIGAVPVYACERHHAEPIIAASEAAGLMVRPLEDARARRLGAALFTAPAAQPEVQAWADCLLDSVRPTAIISTERIGPGADGFMHNSTAQPLQGPDSPFEPAIDISAVAVEAARRGIFSLGIGDFGNEIGFGAIRDTVIDSLPRGDIMSCVIGADIVLPATMSNWGCYAVEACLAIALKRPELMHTAAAEERILRACLNAGGLEAMYCSTEFSVDGLDGESSMACVYLLGNIVRKALEQPSLGLTH